MMTFLQERAVFVRNEQYRCPQNAALLVFWSIAIYLNLLWVVPNSPSRSVPATAPNAE